MMMRLILVSEMTKIGRVLELEMSDGEREMAKKHQGLVLVSHKNMNTIKAASKDSL